ncbi:exonuclease domain-containing protein [Metabacillus iocasae]|uniref:DNA polymerase-3 subunit epsilon n=1 Tax=Priestia iocasae TaxID=2291674 RepID=A0ABS2QVS4_9BACI|nr:exonuclease domain-containing protein [Metabacillus iocasae]MBM7703575.1 DNA polymerase-3 subunit epsilon [Metabacillus iocasae]
MNLERKLAAIVDIETTGLSPHECEMIEVAIVLCSYDAQSGEVIELVDEYAGFNMPSTPIASYITRLTGITNEMVHNHQLNDKKIMELFNKADIIIAHNASFDRSFLMTRYPELIEKKWHCSMRAVKWKDYGFFNKKLTTLLDAHHIKREHAHRAMDDVKATLALLTHKNPNGNPYFLEVMNKAMSKPKIKVNR